jgi:hypothetical protein
MKLFFGLVKLEQTFAHNTPQRVTHGNGPD